MKQIITFTVCILMGITTFSQFSAQHVEHEIIADSEKGYYVINSIMYDGIWILKDNKAERTKRVIIPKQKNHEAKTFYPEDIEEYGFPNGIKYVSSTISFNGIEKKVFIEELVNIDDYIIFYVYSTENKEDIFFILEGEENKLRMINSNSPQEVWNIFLSQNNCAEIQGIENFPKKLTRKRIDVFYRAYRDCNPNLFPKFQYGPVLNLGIGKPLLQETPKYSYPYVFAFSAGGYFQLPFDECTALRTELVYSLLSNNSGSVDRMQKLEKGNAKYLRHSIAMPILFRYTFNFSTLKNVPYMEAGPCFDYCFNGGKIKDGKLVKPEKGIILNESLINFQYGVSIGAGVEHKISHKKSFHLGVRYNWITASRQEYVEKIKFLGVNVAISL